MPLYEYWCEDCEVWFEALGSMSTSMDPKPCPDCGKPAARQMPTSIAAFTMRDGYPRGIPDKGVPYGKIGQYTTGATPAMKAKAAEEDRKHKWEYTINERTEKGYKKKWDEPKAKPKPASSDSKP